MSSLSRSPARTHIKTKRSFSQSFKSPSSIYDLTEQSADCPGRLSLSASASFKCSMSRKDKNAWTEDHMRTRPRSTPDPPSSATWTYKPQRGFQGEELEACRVHIVRTSMSSLPSPQYPRLQAHRPGSWKSDCSTASNDWERARSVARKTRRESIFARDPQNWGHMCFFFLAVLMVVMCRMASKPSSQAAQRLARAKAMQLEMSMSGISFTRNKIVILWCFCVLVCNTSIILQKCENMPENTRTVHLIRILVELQCKDMVQNTLI